MSKWVFFLLTAQLASCVRIAKRGHAGNKCGVRGRGRSASAEALDGPNISIVNGAPAKECDWVWQAALEDRWGFFCGGMLIQPGWVLTAAHCLGGTIDVRLGAYKVESGGTKIRVSKQIEHPRYDQKVESDYDIALLQLSKPARLGGCIGTVCLPEKGRDVPSGTTCWITGWGDLKFDGKSPINLQEVTVQTMSNSQCKNSNYKSSWITDSMLCAQGKNSKGITDACQGDSGGPLVCQSGGAWRVYGATSWGEGCAEKGYPGVWARVHHVLSWIEGYAGR